MNTLNYAQLEIQVVISEIPNTPIKIRTCVSCGESITNSKNKFRSCMRCIDYISEFGSDWAIFV